jgi:hypothetical protein
LSAHVAVTTMRFEIRHHGIPLGVTELVTSQGLAVGEFEPAPGPAPGYVEVRQVVREASKALWDMGFFHRENAQPRVPTEALARAAALQLELRDPAGAQVHADFVNIVERPEPAATPVVFARFRHSHSGNAVAPMPRAGDDKPGNRPDAATL